MKKTIFIIMLVPLLVFGQMGVSVQGSAVRQLDVGAIHPRLEADSSYGMKIYDYSMYPILGPIIILENMYGGYNYAAGDTLTIPGGNGQAKIIVSEVDGDGAVTAYDWIDRGDNYLQAYGFYAQGGSGGDFSATVSKVFAKDSMRANNVALGISDRTIYFGPEVDKRYRYYFNTVDTLSQADLDPTGYNGYADNYYIGLKYNVIPRADSPDLGHYPFYEVINIAGAYNAGLVTGGNWKIFNLTSGKTSEIINQNLTTANYKPLISAKGIWSYVLNMGMVDKYLYGLQANVDNGAISGLYGRVPTAVGGRFRVLNTTSSYGDGSTTVLNAQITDAIAVSAVIEAATVGVKGGRIARGKAVEGSLSTAAVLDTVDYYYSFYGAVANKGKLGSAYLFYGKAPANTGSVANYYGLYLENQSLTGATNNYAIYSNGGDSYHKGQWNTGSLSVNSGTKITAIDSVKTAGGKLRWLKITMGTMTSWVPAYSDTSGKW